MDYYTQEDRKVADALEAAGWSVVPHWLHNAKMVDKERMIKMKESGIKDRVRQWVARVAFSIFLWAIHKTDVQYWAEVAMNRLQDIPCTCEDVGDGLMKWNKYCARDGELMQRLENEVHG